MTLSPALSRWREDLAQFPDEIAIGIGPLLPRIAAALGPLDGSFSEGADPDGFDGVTQRGDYQRLVIGDWLLAQAEPDEFMRRAVMHEHSFLRIALREPKGSRRSIVLFDTGPSQLGSPRLVHVALLIVLARRAAAARAELVWGSLQANIQARSGSQADDIRHLLGARSAFDVCRKDLEHALSRLGPLEAQDDVWLVGGPSCAELAAPRRCSLVVVSDPLRPANDVVEVRVKTRRREQVLSLPLPEPRLRTQLVRNPFEAPRRFEAPGAATGAFWFSPDGKRLLVREGRGVRTRMAVTVGGGWGAPRIPPDDHRLVAATWHKHFFHAVTLVGGRLKLTYDAGSYTLRTTQRPFEPNYGDAPLCQLFVFGKNRRIVLRDAAGTVFVGAVGDGSSKEVELRPILSDVVRLAWRRSHVEYVLRASHDSVELGRVTLELGLFPGGRSSGPVNPERVVCGFDTVGNIGAFAFERREVTQGSAYWELAIGLRSTEVITALDTDRVLGLVCGRGRTPRRQRWSLVVFSPLDGRIYATNNWDRTALSGFESGVAELVQSDIPDRVAYRTSSGKLCVLESLASTKPIVISGGNE